MELPIKLEGIIFQKEHDEYRFLVLHRTPEDGNFWQPLTGTLEDTESVIDCLLRELKEETHITQVKNIIKDVTTFDFIDKYNRRVIEFVYGIEVDVNQEILLEPSEHDEYRWCSLEEALSLLKHESNKQAFQILCDKLVQN